MWIFREEAVGAHLFWVITILTMGLIGALSIDFAQIPGIQETISLMVGFAALALAFVAIGQAFLSDHSVRTSVTRLESAVSRLDVPTQRILASAENIERRIEDLSPLENSVSEDVSSSERRQRIDEKSLIRLSVLSRMSLYAALRSFKTKKNLRALDDSRRRIVSSYLHALHAFGIITLGTGDGDELYVEDLAEISWIEEKVEELKRMKSPRRQEILDKRIAEIDRAFR